MGIAVVAYMADWPREFEKAAAVLETCLAPWLSGAVEHVGSTAVPGLAAKPILDMLAPVADLGEAHGAVPVLAELGYEHDDHRPDEALWFYKQPGDDYRSRTHQLHLTRSGSRLWRERLAFRDALREDADLRDEYATLKHALRHASDLVAYTAGKREFVSAVLAGRGIDLA